MSDLKGGSQRDWLVIGWFTPDYRPLAENLASHLSEHNAPFHLFAKPKFEQQGWHAQIQRKPAVVLEAMNLYPDKTLILMDVDMTVKGDIAPMLDILAGDVAATIYIGDVPRRHLSWTIEVGFSTRVVVFQPTPAAHAFAKTWAAIVREGYNEENAAARALITCLRDGLRFSFIKSAYSGRGANEVSDGVIVHDGARGKQRKASRGPIKKFLRALERPFRFRKRVRRQLQLHDYSA